MNMCCVCGGGESAGGDGESAGGDDQAVCVDTNVRTDGTIINDGADDCDDYAQNTGWCGRFDTDEFLSEQMCCACNGGDRSEGEEEDPVEEEDDEEVDDEEEDDEQEGDDEEGDDEEVDDEEEDDEQEGDDEEGDDEQEGDDQGTIFVTCYCTCEATDFLCLKDCLMCLYPALGDNIVALGDILEATLES
jgi:hypothetical protein